LETEQRFYFPVLRGKQYELLALREMAESITTKNKLRPIVEPLTAQATTNALDVFTEKAMPFCLIVNPREGALAPQSLRTVYQQVVEPYLEQDDIFVPTLYVDTTSTSSDIASFTQLYSGERAFFVLSEPSAAVTSAMVSAEPKYAIFLSKGSTLGTRSKFPHSSRVEITEPFVRLDRNKDYKDDEFFSEEHLRVPNAEFQHFGDYSVIGRLLSAGGPAYCVAIHMVYVKDPNSPSLWIKHYKSDNNLTTANPGGKFIEAVGKLAGEWPTLGPINQTAASKKFIDYASSGEYPGLGKVKQISIMHHLQMMQDKLL
jgi:hypothetical protein